MWPLPNFNIGIRICQALNSVYEYFLQDIVFWIFVYLDIKQAVAADFARMVFYKKISRKYNSLNHSIEHQLYSSERSVKTRPAVLKISGFKQAMILS